MKKFLTWAVVATFAIAGSAFAQGHFTASPNATFTLGAGAAPGPSTTNNDDSCDISVAPAATLLLPYFEVDFNSPQTTARTTLFTITNTSRLPQIAHVTVWTDWSFPVLDFNIFLTGYDVQSINLYDVIARGIIAPGATAGTGGTSSSTAVPTNPTANSQPAANTANPYLATGACSGNQLPGPIPNTLLTDLRLALTTGRPTGAGVACTSQIGGVHANAIGYITVDLAPSCNTSLPNDPTYAGSLLLFDNVLIGDYQDVNPNPATGNYAGGNPMVHIRAVPEGGAAGSAPGTNLPYTFYTRYETTAGTAGIDRRQPLPSVFAARYIQGGTGAFNTNFKIWREGVAIGTCSGAGAASNNANLGATEIVRFDEHENANIGGGSLVISPLPPAAGIPETGAYPTTSTLFPAGPTSGDVAGWMYLNLNNNGPLTGAAQTAGRLPAIPTGQVAGARASQNWVIISMFAEGRYSVDFDAAWLGNGCSGIVPAGTTIGPVGGVLVCPSATAGCTPGVAPWTGTNVTP